MSRIRETNKLRLEDFQDQAKWIGPLLETYNNFISQAINIINGGILFGDNVVGVNHTFEFTFQTQALTFPQIVKWPFKLPPKHVYMTFGSEDDTSIPLTFSWRFNDERLIEIKEVYKITSAPAISDLVAASKYKLRVKAEP